VNFETAFLKLIGPAEEGGYVDNREDNGGPTKYGISQRAYPDLDIKNLTLAQAKMLYKRDYWLPCKADMLPEGIRYGYFSFYVNAPPKTAVRALQTAAGVLNRDGIIGPVTIQACWAMDPLRLQARFTAARLLYYTTLYDWPAFGRGWTAREARNVLNG
jgi:lysozyme family protein